MPDPLLILGAMGVAFAVCGVLVGSIGWAGRQARSTSFDAGWALGIGVGFLLGCWTLGIRPQWPLRGNLDRLFAVVLPAVVVLELVAALPRVTGWFVWPLRAALAACAARALLHGTSYITDLTGPGTSEWPPRLAWLIFGAMSGLVVFVWALLTALARRAPGPAVPIALAVAIAGAAVTVMFSGYLSGGQVGLPLAAALTGAATAAIVLNRRTPRTGPLGVAIVGLFSVLVLGRFFGELTTAHAVLLFCAPLLGWLIELPYVRRLPAWSRGLAAVLLVTAVVGVVLVGAQRKAVQDFQSPSSAQPQEPTVQDYLNFGK